MKIGTSGVLGFGNGLKREVMTVLKLGFDEIEGVWVILVVKEGTGVGVHMKKVG